LSDETDHQTTQERGPTGAADGAGPRLGEVAQILGGLAGVAVLVGGAAFLIGWIYTRAFYERLGIPTRALDLGPTDYITAKTEIWYALASAALVVLVTATVVGGLLPVLGPVRATVLGRLVELEFPDPRAFWLVNLTLGLVNVVWGAVGLGLTDSQGLLYIFATGAAWLLVGGWGIMRESPRWAPLSGVGALVLASVIAILSLGIVAPHLGRQDAEAILRGSEGGTGARFVAAEPLGLPGERYEPGEYVIEAGVYVAETGAYVTESVGVVRATDNAYFVVVRGTQRVYCLSATRVLRVEYTPHEGR